MAKKSKPSKPEYEVAHIQRRCCHQGCRRIVMGFAYKKGEDPKTVSVWCTDHASDAIQK